MNRSTPLRRTPMPPRRTPLPRTSAPARCCLLSRGPVRAVSAKRQKANAQRRVVVSAMRAAAAGRCARCGRRDVPVHGHERLARAHGGDIIHPDCLLCPPCNTWCEDNPRVAAWTGWKCSSKWPQSPDLESWQAWDIDGRLVDFTVLADADGLADGGDAA